MISAAPPVVCPSGQAARGVGTHGAALHIMRSRRWRCEATAFAPGLHRAVVSREASDTRSAPSSYLADAGDG